MYNTISLNPTKQL
ncbi:unnamed protein product [Thlaspi arvense]|uniref:Uncharacterized protein n=1 Tax=Thlaspi arvense TaxID=13288 RepID=A0AAU9S4S2_THLAR|nr:unnamed protein product [Thlaspi arvense]